MLREIMVLDQEVIHFYEQNNIVSSKGSVLTISINNKVKSYQMPRSIMDYVFPFRLFRRLLRLDKCNVLKIGKNFDRFLVIRLGKSYIFDRNTETFDYKFSLRQCRNVLHNSICETPEGKIIFGEYGANLNFAAVPIHLSNDSGQSWEEVDLFENGEIKHIHCISYDPYTGDIWILTGDYEGQCMILVCDQSLKVKERLGDGGQDWRTCGVAFEKEFVYWGMDSPLKPSFIIKFSRSAKTIEKVHPVEGPVWYIKSLSDGITLAGVTVEPGASVVTKSAQIVATRDYENWRIIAEFEKDKWSMKWFKYGVLCFADGNQSSESFAVFGEALKNFDGVSRFYAIDKEGDVV